MSAKMKMVFTWLRERNIMLEESFVPAFRRYAIQYQNQCGYTHLNDVYRLTGTHKAQVSYWESHPYSTQTKNF